MGAEGRRLALIVASSEFVDETLQKLITPGQDAADLAHVLGDPTIGAFETRTLINRPSHEVRREIESFFARRKRDDLLLLYFSGHGVKDEDGRLYLTTTDTQRDLLRSTAVPATFINETMTVSRSRRQVLILDCCHSGAFARGMVAKGGESVDLRHRFDGRGRVVLTASNATQYAFQGDEIVGIDQVHRSVFTHHLVQGLETGQADLDGDGWVTLDELYDYVYEHIVDEMPQQTPGKWTFDLQGEIFIASNPLGPRLSAAEETQRSAQYAEAIGALTTGQWERALQVFEALEAESPGYRDVTEQITRLRQLTSALNKAPSPSPSPSVADTTETVHEFESTSARPSRFRFIVTGILGLLLSTVLGWGVGYLLFTMLHDMLGVNYEVANTVALTSWALVGLGGLVLTWRKIRASR